MEEYIVFNSDELTDLISSIISEYKNIFSEEISSIFANNATIKLSIIFCHNRNHYKSPIKPYGLIKLYVSIFPVSLTEKQSIAACVHQKFYSIIGKYKKLNKGYQITLYKSPDTVLKNFISKYAKKLSSGCPEDALKQKINDIFRSWIFYRRFGNDYLKKYRNVNVCAIVLGFILIIVFILRLFVPRGYHPSLR